MKDQTRQYKILAGLIAVEYLILACMNVNGTRMETFTGKLIVVIVFLVPILRLLYLLGEDEKVTMKIRNICKVIFWFVIFCTCAGGIATILEIYGLIP